MVHQGLMEIVYRVESALPCLCFTSAAAQFSIIVRQVNEQGTTLVPVTCPECSTPIDVDISRLGGS